jgi:3-oxoacyl-[acyl-carrier-protein] synthase-3
LKKVNEAWSAKIIGTGSFLPENVLTNKDLEQLMDTTDEWIQSKYGIKERRVVGKEDQISTLSIEAAKRALTDANIEAEDIDLIILASINSDVKSPATACFVQAELGAKNSIAFDMNVGGCPNSAFALLTGIKYMDPYNFKNVLVICTEIYTKFIDWKYRNTACFLADGSGAVVLTLCGKEQGVLGYDFGVEGTMAKSAWWPTGGTLGTISENVEMDGQAVWDFGHSIVPQSINNVLKQSNFNPNEVDFYIFHQANINIIQNIMKMFSVPLNKTHINNDKFGNTGGASSLIALDEARRKGLVKKGDKLLFCAYGSGLAWGTLLFQM